MSETACTIEEGQKKTAELLHTPLVPLYRKYLFTSILSSLATSLYIFFDTLFLGRGVGSAGLATITFAMPLILPVSAIASLFSSGGAPAFAVECGKGDNKKAAQIFSLSMTATLVCAAILTVLAFVFMDPLCRLTGTPEEMLPMVRTYVSVFAAALPLFFLSAGLGYFIRSDGEPQRVMTAVLASNAFNIVMDYVFVMVFGWGVFGAALATSMSPLVALLILLPHLFRPESRLRFIKPEKQQLGHLSRVVRNGLVGFVGEGSAGVIIALYNHAAGRFGGIGAVAAYSLSSSITFIMQNLLMSAAMSGQPIASTSFGAGDKKRVQALSSLVLRTTAALGVVFAVFYALLRRPLSALFTSTGDMGLIEGAAQAGIFFALALAIMPYFYARTATLYAVERARDSNLAMVLRCLVFPALALLLLPPLVGNITGVWMAAPAAELASAAVAFLLYRRAAPVIFSPAPPPAPAIQKSPGEPSA